MDRLGRAFMRFLRIEAMAGGILLICAALALALSNSAWSGHYLAFWELQLGIQVDHVTYARSLKHWINDGLMTFFFFVVALELKREMVLGELRKPRTAALSLAAALGGMAVPAAVYLLLQGGGPAMHGWGTVMATDTAFLIGCLAVLGRRIPQSLRVFLLSLAIFDDIGAILVVAIGYGDALNGQALAAAMLGILLTAALAKAGIRSVPVYIGMGAAVWLAMDLSGVHATLAGVVLGLMTPARSWVNDSRLRAILGRVVAHPPGEHWSGDTLNRQDLLRAEVATREALSPVERLEIALHPWVAFVVMPVFALANAGMTIVPADIVASTTVAIVAGFVIGKPLGIVAFSYLAVRLRLAVRPSGLPWSMLATGSLLAGIGFTMALFIAELAFDTHLLASAKLGILVASIVSATVGLLALAGLTARQGRTGRSPRTARP
ncbi:Na(+)/H(+) antiporter NhaA [Dokdonella koreensis DS-123]|uniref:Na(+)/H(+) antiporter NhaA n=2 Tax=Dokdonella TaxID=323413 RepID=A0A160DUU9_9GAMM|nr:Na(+)/H(+) antiporter NhaA [Dokdonella koreensis DS-123]